jgi:uncharacterized alkaline shock family protein YloU
VSGFERLTLVLDVLLGLVLALLAVGVAIHPHWAEAPPWGTSLGVAARWGIGAVGAAWTVVSISLLRTAFRGDARLPRVHVTELGDVRVSLGAVENMVMRVAAQARGIRDAKVRVAMTPDGAVAIDVRAWVMPEVNIPQLAGDLQTAIRHYLRSVVGLDVSRVTVTVSDIGGESRRGRVTG